MSPPVDFDRWGPPEGLVPCGTTSTPPTAAELEVWDRCVVDVYLATGRLLAPPVRVVWYHAFAPTTDRLMGQVFHGDPPLIVLRAGRPPRDLQRTCYHELYHVVVAPWDREEANAYRFADRMMRRG